jgi:hypothetical protein
MNYAYRLLFIILLFSSCKNEPELSFSSESFTQENLEICQDQPCSTVVIDYVKASGNAEISEKINANIKEQIIEALFLGDDTSPTVKDIPEAAAHFILAYRDHQPDFPSELDFESYEAEVTITNPFLNENRACIEIQLYLFTGGAHGYGGTSFINFDVQTGEEIKTKDLFINYDEFETFAETKFKEAHNIPLEDNINASGFWFDNDTFYLPESLGFDDHGLIAIYNQYDIASYAEGSILLEIPYFEVLPFLDKQYR